jgi:chromosome condensin MukBEF complex kleisin-like MukF subunit
MYTVKIDKIEVFVQGEQQEPVFTKLADGIIKDFVQRNVIVVERGKHDEIDVAMYVLTFLDFSFRDKGYTLHEAGEIWTTTKQAVSVRIVANEYSRAIDSATSGGVRCISEQRIDRK